MNKAQAVLGIIDDIVGVLKSVLKSVLKCRVTTVDSIMSTYRDTIDDLEAHIVLKDAERDKHLKVATHAIEGAYAAKLESVKAKVCAEKLKNLFA